MQTAELLERLRHHFYEGVEHKTGWGSQELKLLFEQSVNRAVSDLLALAHDELRKASR